MAAAESSQDGGQSADGDTEPVHHEMEDTQLLGRKKYYCADGLFPIPTDLSVGEKGRMEPLKLLFSIPLGRAHPPLGGEHLISLSCCLNTSECRRVGALAPPPTAPNLLKCV